MTGPHRGINKEASRETDKKQIGHLHMRQQGIKSTRKKPPDKNLEYK